MKLVRFNRDMRGMGNHAVLPDDVADRVVADGEGQIVESIYDTQPRDEAPPAKRKIFNRRA